MTPGRSRSVSVDPHLHTTALFGGSDAHRPDEIGRAVTEVRVDSASPLTVETVLEGMRAGQTDAVGRRVSTWQRRGLDPPSQLQSVLGGRELESP